jgi:hypothetical protein
VPTCIGCGLTTDTNGLLIAHLKSGGGLSCDDNGIAVIPPGGPGSVIPGPSNAPSVTIGSNDCALDKDQLLENAGGGVRALHTGSKAGIANGPLSWDGIDIFMNPASPGVPNFYTLEGPIIQIGNNCGGTLAGTTEFAAGGVVVEMGPGGYVECNVEINQTYGGIAWAGQSPSQTVIMDNRFNSQTVVHGIWLVDRAWQIVSAAQTLSLGVRLVFSCSFGPASGPTRSVIKHRPSSGYELTWHYSHYKNDGLSG